MKKTAFLLLAFAMLSLAAPCSDYYSPNSVSVSAFSTGKPSYSPGETAVVSLEARNSFATPLAELVPLVLVYRGETLTGLFPLEESALSANGTVPISFSWKVPQNSVNGQHSFLVEFYSSGFKVGESGRLFFGVSGSANSGLAISSVSGGNGHLSAELENIGGESQAVVSVEVVSGNPVKNAKVFSLMQEGLVPQGSALAQSFNAAQQATQQLNNNSGGIALSLAAGERASLSYSFPSLPPGSYELLLTVKKGDAKAMARVPVESEGDSAELVFAGLDVFPLSPGSPASLFFCARSLSGAALNATGSIEARSNGMVIAKALTPLELQPSPTAAGGRFISPPAVDNAVVVVELRDANGRLLDVSKVSFSSTGISHSAVISVSASSKNDAINYAVELNDSQGLPVQGKITLVLVKDGFAFKSAEGIQMRGRLAGSFNSLPAGSYELKAIEPALQVSASAAAVVRETKLNLTPSSGNFTALPPAAAESFNFLPVIALVLVVALLVVLKLLWKPSK